MAISHIFTSPVADQTGTVTVFNSAGVTTTTAASALVKPSNWNSAHNQFMTISGNTAGASTASGTNIVLQGGANVTLSVTDQTIIFSNNGLTTAAASNHSHGDPTLALTNLSGTTASNSAGLTLSLSAAAPGGGAAISAAGASASNGTIVFSNSNGVSFGMNGSTVTGSHNGLTTARASNDAVGLNTAQTNVTWTVNSAGLSFNAAGYAGTGYTSTTTAGTAIVATHNTAGLSLAFPTIVTNALTTAALSNHSHGNPTLALTNLSGTTASASNGLTLSLSAAAPSAATLSAYAVSNTTNSTSGALPGVVSFGGYGGISLGVSNGTVQVSGPALTSLAATGALSASSDGNTISLGVGTVTASIIGNTTQTSSGSINLNALVFSGAGGASLGISAGTVIVSGGAGGGAAVTVSDAATSGTVGRLAFTNLNGVTLSLSTGAGGSHTIVGSHNALTTAAASNHSHGNPTLALTNLSGTTASASNGLTLSLSAAAQTNQSAIRGFGVSNTGATAGNTGVSTGIDWVLAGSQSLTLSQSTAGGGPNTVWIQHPAWLTTAAASNHSHGNPTLALTNLTGTTASASNGLTISLSANAPGAAAESNAFNLLGANTAGNTTATGSTIGLSGVNMTLSGTNASQIVLSVPATSSLVGAGGISLSTNGSTITVSYTKGTKSGFSPYADLPMTITTLGNGTLQLDPMVIGDVQWDRLICLVNNTNSSNSSGSHTLSFWAGLYSRNGNTLSLHGSASVSYALTHSGTQGSYSLYSGLRALTMPWTTTITDGQYWFGLVSRTTSGGTNGSYSMAAASVGLGSNFSGHFGSSHATTAQVTLGQGVYTATTSGMPAAIEFSQLRGSDSQNFKAPIVWFASSTV